MEKTNKLVYQPPKLEAVDLKLLASGDDLVPGASQVIDPDDDPDF